MKNLVLSFLFVLAAPAISPELLPNRRTMTRRMTFLSALKLFCIATTIYVTYMIATGGLVSVDSILDFMFRAAGIGVVLLGILTTVIIHLFARAKEAKEEQASIKIVVFLLAEKAGIDVSKIIKPH